MRRFPRRRPNVRRVVVVVPSMFTLANLFFGIWSLVLAGRGDFYRASWYIVIAGVLDMLDGRVARMSNTGSRFGAELDSLVDLVSFGVAPAVLIYHLVLAQAGGFAWLFSYGFVMCVALRLARFNVGDMGHGPSDAFQGLPSPAAGMTLATYFPFTQTAFYQSQVAALPWSQLMVFLMMALSLAMVSTIRYAKLPRIGIRSARGLGGLAINLTVLGFGIFSRDIFFFPLGLAYLTYGMVRAAVVGFLERGEGDEPDDDRPDDPETLTTPMRGEE
ncbi:MAG TPA: CDP-diacylglycerol--serine O-phosphatidyltransferase [Gemmatimonadales bacterium]|jgi:CDP-diacylglycerol--serine O-phosphatidyltransferase